MDDNQLLFSQSSLLPPIMTRLIDGLSTTFSPELKFCLHDFNGVELEEDSWSTISDEEDARFEVIKSVLGTARIFNPVEEILKGLDHADVKAETERLENLHILMEDCISTTFPATRTKKRKKSKNSFNP